jgi:hypothetical protein
MQARADEAGGALTQKKKAKGKKFDEAEFLKELKEHAVQYSTEPLTGSDTRVKRQFLIFSATLVHVDYTRLFKSGAKGTFAKRDGIAMSDEESKSSSFERCRWLVLWPPIHLMYVWCRLIGALNLPTPPLVFDFTSRNLMVERLVQ